MVKIICEGKDDKDFLKLFLRHLKKDGSLSISTENFDSYIETMNGKAKLLNQENYETINKQIGKKIKKVLFIFDCDFVEDDKKCGNLENSTTCIEDLIKDLNWSIDTSYYIFSKNLDYFLIDTLKNREQFEACEECFKLKELNKNRKILTCIYNKLYPKPPYDFSHPNFNELKEKLNNLFN